VYCYICAVSDSFSAPNGQSAQIIAEIGLIHEGSLGLALSMSAEVAKLGANIIKFQAHFPDEESSREEKFRVHFSLQDETRWDYWQRTSFTSKEWGILKREVESMGAAFSVSVFSSYALNFFLDIGVSTLKLGSGDLLNYELLEGLADFEGTLLMSTGMSTWMEIEEAASWLKDSKCDSSSAILQCTSKYPAPLDQVGINVMLKIDRELGVKSGLSDHSRGLSASYLALSSGARYIEKHVTPSPFMFGPDIASSIDFVELARIVQFRNDLSSLRQTVDKDLVARELTDLRKLFGRSLGLRHDFPAGHRVTLDDFCLRKPGGGLSWGERQKFLGQELTRPYTKGELLARSHFAESNQEVQR
jgi:N,N'-diacetyllegionaminate synthase